MKVVSHNCPNLRYPSGFMVQLPRTRGPHNITKGLAITTGLLFLFKIFNKVETNFASRGFGNLLPGFFDRTHVNTFKADWQLSFFCNDSASALLLLSATLWTLSRYRLIKKCLYMRGGDGVVYTVLRDTLCPGLLSGAWCYFGKLEREVVKQPPDKTKFTRLDSSTTISTATSTTSAYSAPTASCSGYVLHFDVSAVCLLSVILVRPLVIGALGLSLTTELLAKLGVSVVSSSVILISLTGSLSYGLSHLLSTFIRLLSTRGADELNDSHPYVSRRYNSCDIATSEVPSWRETERSSRLSKRRRIMSFDRTTGWAKTLTSLESAAMNSFDLSFFKDRFHVSTFTTTLSCCSKPALWLEDRQLLRATGASPSMALIWSALGSLIITLTVRCITKHFTTFSALGVSAALGVIAAFLFSHQHALHSSVLVVVGFLLGAHFPIHILVLASVVGYVLRLFKARGEAPRDAPVANSLREQASEASTSMVLAVLLPMLIGSTLLCFEQF
eukprot:Blabericola_migrator_1__10786@NODE_619_length_7247_cov_387_220752_g452_i0_p3_GENE_NODE_619_length_7247_cov_387_220752_g452_i0NODE_619_length_7247_cov_387_220752_g452_i0_p3_ORF_typecomplete_len502_score39_40MFS_2/PF13347_6/88MFS_2/PF13347_6/0_0013Hum_adeno_E3A/PF05393_11/0_1SpoIIM/PF01944_17/1_1e03SpoIIM/PF01944_17/0_076_NODE_619_length_7247_cov_387_220752_g452_i05472052